MRKEKTMKRTMMMMHIYKETSKQKAGLIYTPHHTYYQEKKDYPIINNNFIHEYLNHADNYQK